jgi:hypothetical protein
MLNVDSSIPPDKLDGGMNLISLKKAPALPSKPEKLQRI